MRIYKSKVDFWLIAFLGGMLILPVLISVITGGSVWPAGLICGGVALFTLWLYFATQYRVTEDKIIIHAGLYKVIIPMNSIQSITRTRNPLSSPAFSLDRLEIKYAQTKIILISPKERDRFLADIGWLKDNRV